MLPAAVDHGNFSTNERLQANVAYFAHSAVVDSPILPVLRYLPVPASLPRVRKGEGNSSGCGGGAAAAPRATAGPSSPTGLVGLWLPEPIPVSSAAELTRRVTDSPKEREELLIKLV